jgi:hypothetical protein
MKASHRRCSGASWFDKLTMKHLFQSGSQTGWTGREFLSISVGFLSVVENTVKSLMSFDKGIIVISVSRPEGPGSSAR